MPGPDPFLLALVATVLLASFLPARFQAVPLFQDLTVAVIAFMFLMQGVRMSRTAMLAGLGHWRLHPSILPRTFALFPALRLGVLFTCLLPSTVQSSATTCSPSCCRCRSWAASCCSPSSAAGRRATAGCSEAVVRGLWREVPGSRLALVLLVDAILLAAVLLVTRTGPRAAGFPREDEIAIVFCGSKKTLVSGVPMDGVLFPGALFGQMVLPLMVFHQIQLSACAPLARRSARQARPATPTRFRTCSSASRNRTRPRSGSAPRRSRSATRCGSTPRAAPRAAAG